jgi:glycerate kinase
LDVEGKQVPFGAVGLKYIVKIDASRAMAELKECTFSVACDVTNPLCGEKGCSAIFAPQKGANQESIEYMDNWLMRYARLTKKIIPTSDENAPGTGAAGGLGYAFMTYLNATLRSGIELVINATGVEEYIKTSDCVVTGEGRLDGQSVMGKAPVGIAALAKKYGKRVIALSGCVTDDAYKCNEYGIDAFFPILKAPCTLDEAMKLENASKNLADTSEQVFRLIKSIE